MPWPKASLLCIKGYFHWDAAVMHTITFLCHEAKLFLEFQVVRGAFQGVSCMAWRRLKFDVCTKVRIGWMQANRRHCSAERNLNWKATDTRDCIFLPQNIWHSTVRLFSLYHSTQYLWVVALLPRSIFLISFKGGVLLLPWNQCWCVISVNFWGIGFQFKLAVTACNIKKEQCFLSKAKHNQPNIQCGTLNNRASSDFWFTGNQKSEGRHFRRENFTKFVVWPSKHVWIMY